MSEEYKSVQADQDDRSEISIWLIILATIVLVALVIVGLEGYFSAKDAASLGQWGDFFGGLLNPILSFMAFCALLYTIILQRSELNLTRNELRLSRIEMERSSAALEDQNLSMKQQRFESTFFGMVNVFNQIIDAMDVTIYHGYDRGSSNYSGRDCFNAFCQQLRQIYVARSYCTDPVHKPYDGGGGPLEYIEYPHDFERINESYKHFFGKFSTDLAHYFRVLYNIYRYIDQSEFGDGIYAKILRAQLSNQELTILFYNCHSNYGLKFLDFAEKYKIFDNMDSAGLIIPEHSASFFKS